MSSLAVWCWAISSGCFFGLSLPILALMFLLEFRPSSPLRLPHLKFLFVCLFECESCSAAATHTGHVLVSVFCHCGAVGCCQTCFGNEASTLGCCIAGWLRRWPLALLLGWRQYWCHSGDPRLRNGECLSSNGLGAFYRLLRELACALGRPQPQ